MRALVQDPMNTRSIAIASIAVPGSSAMYWRARSSVSVDGAGTLPLTGTDCPGFVPQVTYGSRRPASIDTSRSKVASRSDVDLRHRSTA